MLHLQHTDNAVQGDFPSARTLPAAATVKKKQTTDCSAQKQNEFCEGFDFCGKFYLKIKRISK
jgi:hypothetical protein